MANDDIGAQINKLAEKLEGGREDHLKEVEAMRAVFKNATIRKNLAKNPAFQKLLGALRKRDDSITTVLDNKEDLTEMERAKLFARRKEVRFVLSFFDSADAVLKGLREKLAYELSDEITPDVDNGE